MAGFRHFGLHDAATVVMSIAQQAARLDIDDPEAAERLEAEADDRYAQAVPDDSTLTGRFEQALQQHPDSFAPFGS